LDFVQLSIPSTSNLPARASSSSRCRHPSAAAVRLLQTEPLGRLVKQVNTPSTPIGRIEQSQASFERQNPSRSLPILEEELMLSSSFYRNANCRGREAEHSNRQPAAAPRSCSPNAKCQFCEFIEASKWESASDEPSTPQSASACPSYLNDPTTFGHCRPPKRMKVPQAPVCVDPECSDNVCEECSEKACDECSDHEDNCEDCVSNCRVSVCGDWAADCSTHNGNQIDDPYFELFGNQVAQMFSLDDRLPQLATESVPVGYGGIGFCPDAPMLAGHVGPRNSFGPYDQLELSSAPMHFPTQFQGLEGSVSAQLDCSMTTGTLSTFSADWPSSLVVERGVPGEGTAPNLVSSFEPFENKLIPARTPHTSSSLHVSNLTNFAQLIRTKPVAIAPAHSVLSQECDVAQMRPSPNRPNRPWTRCQWVEPNGQPCGKLSESGSEMHEHLKTAHNVNREVFCRWLGCHFGVLGPTPHKYANSVERHTWGHSGYRPYKCPTCSEGFAAANVRDEHFANFHLKRKMFSCDICSHQCTSARNLKRHKDDTHKTERFQCEFCNRNGKIRLFPRGSNLARHFRKCKYVLALFPDAIGTATGKIDDDWFPPGYRGGHQGMEKAKIVPPNYLQVTTSV